MRWGLVRGRLLELAVAAVLVVGDWMAWFSWDHEYQLGSDGYYHGPYETWQVVGFVLILGLIAAALGWVDQVVSGGAVSSIAAAVAFSVSAIADKGSGDGLWLVGAIMVAAGVFCGVCAVAAIFRALRRQLSR